MRFFVLSAALVTAFSSGLQAQIPEKFENLEVLPKDISRNELTQVMRAFALGLGVRCQYCHVVKAGANPNSLESLDFKSDDKIEKKKARVMMKMVHTINTTLLSDVPERAQPQVNVQCVTCHRGSPLPKTLDRVLVETIEKQGVDSAVVRYRQLREQTLVQGRYNFSEQTLNEVAQQLVAAQKTAEAIRMLELNQEFNPGSAQIDFQMGEIHRARGEKDQAIARYRKALEKQPNHPQATRRLGELTN
jgi:tetratricopeptide (TPR) repeat protein